MAFPLTEEQRKIVDDRGGELLVSAAAGSGKTRVLVERLLDRVTGEGLDITQFFIDIAVIACPSAQIQCTVLNDKGLIRAGKTAAARNDQLGGRIGGTYLDRMGTST